MTKADHSKMIFRVPLEIRAWLETTAKGERRTMTAQLLHILEQARDAKQSQPKAA